MDVARPRGDGPAEVVVGYTTPLVARPGEKVAVKVSTGAPEYRATAVRLTGASSGGVVAAEPLESLACDPLLAGRRQPLRTGSSVVVGPSSAFAQPGSMSVGCWVQQTLATSRPQTILGTLNEAASAGWRIVVDARRGAGLVAAAASGVVELFAEQPVPVGVWTFVAATIDVEHGRAGIHQRPRGGAAVATETPGWPEHRGGDLLVVGAPIDGAAELTAEGNGSFNGKIAGPAIVPGALGPEGIARLEAGDAGAAPVCALDFSDAIGTRTFADRSPARHAAVLVNGPMAGVTGPRWRGASSSFIQAPGDYDALRFHDDDLEDARWETDVEIDVPADLPRGIYAVRLETGDCVDTVPFFVTAPTAPPRSDVALLAPTLTYLAYANEHEALSNPPSYVDFTGRDPDPEQLGWRDRLAIDERLLSLYDVHRDGSTVAYASTRRPMLNLRPDYVWPLIDGPHGLGVELRLLGWLGRAGYEVDVLTDHDLDGHGLDAIAPYRVLLTGGHPEYWTATMLDALEAWLGAGGRLMYLGGNGFYWVTGIDPEARHVAEVRRGHANSRPSSSAPGESWLTTTREEGGIWRHRGRAPNGIVGVGFAAMGGGPGRPYRRTEDSRHPEVEFVFEGVDGEELGGQGAILGAAAAYEFDRADRELGTPADAHVLATASGFASLYYPVIEDFMAARPEIGDPGSPLVRADAVLVPGPAGGAVFSSGSAAWCAALEDESGPTDVGRVTANVLRRFLETPPGGVADRERLSRAGRQAAAA